MKKSGWRKLINKYEPADVVIKTDFNAATKPSKHRSTNTNMTAKGTPDIAEIRKEVSDRMKKLRNAK